MCQMRRYDLSSVLQAVPIDSNESWDSAPSYRQERARFQQKQLQEKEEKLVKLYEEQQERALKSVGSRSHSGGSSVSSTSSVGVGKVRHMFQARRGNSEPKLGAPITGRDKSYPLEPLTKHPSARNSDRSHRFSTSRTQPDWRSAPHGRSVSLDRNTVDFAGVKNDNHCVLELDENSNQRKAGVRRTLIQARSRKPGFENCGELKKFDRGRSFRLVDENWCRRNAYGDSDDDYPLNYDVKKENQERNKPSQRPPRNESTDLEPNRMEGRYRSYVSQSTFTRKPHLGNGTLPGRSGVTGRAPPEAKETPSSGYLNGSVSSPVRKIRKPTPVPLSVTPPQHLLQKEIKKTSRIETIREVPSSVPSSRSPTSRTQPATGSFQKPPTPGKTSARVSAIKSTPPAPSAGKSGAVQSDLVNCRICGRHFAADRVSKHEEVCQKSSRTKRKPFDALQQRVKGTEVEQFVRKSAKSFRAPPEKAAKPQSNWRKKHEEFINNIRAAKEVSAHLKKGGKLSDLPPPPPSDYSDYVPCPHCGRKFNSSAAERHIPKCANIINNKPKPNLQKNPGLKQPPKLLHSTSPSVRGRK